MTLETLKRANEIKRRIENINYTERIIDKSDAAFAHDFTDYVKRMSIASIDNEEGELRALIENWFKKEKERLQKELEEL